MALERYSTLLTSDVSHVESVLIAAYGYDNVIISGSRELIDFEHDTLMLIDFSYLLPGLPFASFVPGDKIRNVLWSRSRSLFPATQLVMDWDQIAAYFPNLKEFNLVLGEYLGTSAEKDQNQQYLLPLDSNLVDLFSFYLANHPKSIPSFVLYATNLLNRFGEAATINHTFWSFAMGDKVPEKWSKLKFSMSIWTEENRLSSNALSVGWNTLFGRLKDVPRLLRAEYKDCSFPRKIRFRRDVCDDNGELLSRYDGLKLLFEESESSLPMSPPSCPCILEGMNGLL